MAPAISRTPNFLAGRLQGFKTEYTFSLWAAQSAFIALRNWPSVYFTRVTLPLIRGVLHMHVDDGEEDRDPLASRRP